jgi:hypothetical protein
MAHLGEDYRHGRNGLSNAAPTGDRSGLSSRWVGVARASPRQPSSVSEAGRRRRFFWIREGGRPTRDCRYQSRVTQTAWWAVWRSTDRCNSAGLKANLIGDTDVATHSLTAVPCNGRRDLLACGLHPEPVAIGRVKRAARGTRTDCRLAYSRFRHQQLCHQCRWTERDRQRDHFPAAQPRLGRAAYRQD